MDRLTCYIQKGKKLTFFKSFSVLFALTLLIVGVVGLRLNKSLSDPDLQSFLKEVPTLEIQDGQVVRPENMVWEKKFADGQFLFKIDTTQNASNDTPENGIIVTQKNIVFALNSQVSQHTLPQEKIVVDTPFLTNLFRTVMINTCVVIGIVILLILLLGQAATLILTSFCLWLFRKEIANDQVRRSSFIGWLAVLFLNLALVISGHGFTLIICVGIATAISVFSLLWADRN